MDVCGYSCHSVQGGGILTRSCEAPLQTYIVITGL